MRIYLFIVPLVLAGCTSTPKTAEEYWFGQGERFGSRGYSSETNALDKMKEEIPFDKEAYQKGYRSGINEYCDPFQAFNKGISGIRYAGQCDDQKEVVMIKAEWERGWQAFLSWDFSIK